MGRYHVEWPCCGDVSVTNGYEPSECPFCTPSRKPAKVLDAAWVVLVKKPGTEPDYMQSDAGITLMDEARAVRWAKTTVGVTTFEAHAVQIVLKDPQ